MAVLADMNPMRDRTISGSSTTSKPATSAVPLVGRKIVDRHRKAVVLPAPLGPKRPKISPGRHSKFA